MALCACAHRPPDETHCSCTTETPPASVLERASEPPPILIEHEIDAPPTLDAPVEAGPIDFDLPRSGRSSALSTRFAKTMGPVDMCIPHDDTGQFSTVIRIVFETE